MHYLLHQGAAQHLLLRQVSIQHYLFSFSGDVKLKGFIVIGGEGGSHPSEVRLYVAIVSVPRLWSLRPLYV